MTQPEIEMPDLSNIPAPEGEWGEWEAEMTKESEWASVAAGDGAQIMYFHLVARRKAKKPTVEGWLTTSLGGMCEFFSERPFRAVGHECFGTSCAASKCGIFSSAWPALGCCCEFKLTVDAVAGQE